MSDIIGRPLVDSTEAQRKQPSGRIIADMEGAFARNYNRKPFMFAHNLKGNRLFELQSLIDLCARMPDHSETYWSNGMVPVSATWETARAARHSLMDTAANIATNNSMIILKHTEQDPIHGPVLKQVLSEFVEYAGEQLRGDVIAGEALILISSPNRLTPYHIDAETNYLVQVAGDKILNVFDHTDRTLITDEEQEAYHLGNYSGAVYKEDRQKDAMVFDLRAGHGVHIPVAAPHWVRNGDNVSVALSINYELRSVERASRVFRLNHKLRRLGLNPTPPGVSAWRDQLKVGVMTTMTSVTQTIGPRRKPAAGYYPIWSPSGDASNS